MDYTTASSDRSNVRVPKLAVRNRSDNSIPLSDEASPATSTTSVASQSPVPLDRRVSEHSVGTTRAQQQARQQETSAKKSSGVFGFLSLKEPSTSAWEDYAKQQKQQVATAKHGTPTAGSLPGVSKQKLPDHVPKVNSKWDGLPDSTKKNGPRRSQSSRRRQSGQTKRCLNDDRSLDLPENSRTARVTPQESKRGSIKSTPTSILDGIEVLPQADAEQAIVTLYSARESSQIAASRMQASSRPKYAIPFPNTRDRSQSPALITSPTSPEFALELDSTEVPQLTSVDLHTSPEASPQTPPADRHIHHLDQPNAFWLSDMDTISHSLPSTPAKSITQPHTPVSSPAKSLVMNFSRPSRPLIETSRPSLSSPTPRDPGLSPPSQAPALALEPFNEPVELPCPSTCPPSPTPRPQAKGPHRLEHDGTKRGRLSVMLGFR